MPAGAHKYGRGGVAVVVGQKQQVVELPPRTFRARLRGFLFETDKSFLLPSAMAGIRRLKQYYDDHPGLKVLVVGHADRAGEAEPNRLLSVERAEAIAAFLQDRVEDWLAWYGAGKPAAKRWGLREDQHMLTAVSDGQGPLYGGPANGRDSDATRAAARRLQHAAGLSEDGVIGAATRRELVTRYMALDGTTLPAGTVLMTHGCGEFHPEVATPDGIAEERNRRVEVFLFEAEIDPAPRARCAPPGCPEHALWVARAIETVDVRGRPGLLEGSVTYADGSPAAGVPFVVECPGGRKCGGYTDDQGRYRVDGIEGAATLRLVDELLIDTRADGAGAIAQVVDVTGNADAETAVA